MAHTSESEHKAANQQMLDWLLNCVPEDCNPESIKQATSLQGGALETEFQRVLGCGWAEFLRQQELQRGRMPAAAFISEPGPSPRVNLVMNSPAVALEAQQIAWGMGQSYFGECLLAATRQGICSIDLQPNENSLPSLQAVWPGAILQRDDAWAASAAESIFGESNKPLTVHMMGTGFQLRVWRALLGIPLGSCISYGALAGFIGAPMAARAVGTAVGNNPLAMLVPCHRVLPATGKIGGYRWGSARKWALLVREQLADSKLSLQAA